MSHFIFGSGSIYATPLVDATGAAVAIPTPVKFLACQDISADISFDVKTLHGQNQFPLAVARGKGKVTVKAKHGQVNAALYNNAFFGQTVSTGQDQVYQDLIGAAIPATPFVLVKTPVSSGVWSADLGVRNMATGAPFTRVAATATPTTTQYVVSQPFVGSATFATNVMTVTSVTSGGLSVGQVITSAGVTGGTYIAAFVGGTGGTGTYTLSTTPGTITPTQAVTGVGGCYLFASADNVSGISVMIDYRYTVTTGNKIAIANQLLGSTPTVSVDIVVPYAGKMLTVKFPNAIAGKMAMATKLDDFTVPEVDFDCFVDSSGNVGTIGFAE